MPIFSDLPTDPDELMEVCLDSMQKRFQNSFLIDRIPSIEPVMPEPNRDIFLFQMSNHNPSADTPTRPRHPVETRFYLTTEPALELESAVTQRAMSEVNRRIGEAVDREMERMFYARSDANVPSPPDEFGYVSVTTNMTWPEGRDEPAIIDPLTFHWEAATIYRNGSDNEQEVIYARDIRDDEPTIDEAWAALEQFKAARNQ